MQVMYLLVSKLELRVNLFFVICIILWLKNKFLKVFN